MTSKVEICNKALGLLSANLIMAFDPAESVEAALCVTNYDSARRYAIEKRAWTFATKRVVLSTPITATDDDWGYDFKQLKPADCIRILAISDTPILPNGGSKIDFRVEGNHIVSNFSELYVKYLFDEIEETRFSPSFVEAMALYLAYLMATPLTESKSLKNELLQTFENMTSAAAATDGMQGSSDRVRSSRLLDVRRVRGRNTGWVR